VWVLPFTSVMDVGTAAMQFQATVSAPVMGYVTVLGSNPLHAPLVYDVDAPFTPTDVAIMPLDVYVKVSVKYVEPVTSMSRVNMLPVLLKVLTT
jgi:hypothetical protein